MSASEPAVVLFDGDCAFCRKSVSILKKLDWLHRLDYVNFREPTPAVQNLELNQERLAEEMHVVTPQRAIYHGFGAFRWMSWRMPATWLIAPFLYIPGVPWLGQKVYLWIARHRYQIIPCHHGECQIPRKRG